ncbi:MAG TPA: VWA domain-containing protein, partial [Roseimicrobium sp.]|nr:VWA domain-containing protein [Roseimicrobium sp.]
PVPKGSQLDKFTLEIDVKPVAGELLAADKARGIYEDIVRRTLDPALLEYAGKDLFKIRAFPVDPGSSRKLMVRYTQLLTVESGMTRLVVPLLKGGTGVRPPDSLALGVTVETRRPLKTIYSPTHRVDLKRESNRATLGFEQRDASPSGDFQLYFSAEQDEVGTQLLTYRAPGEKEGYFVLFASPGGGDTKEKKKIAPKDVVFVLDTSGSMAGKKMEQARKALQFCVESLNPQDRFEVVRFSTDTEPLFKQLVDASKDNRARATAYLETLQATGSTAIDAALREALSLRPAENTRPFLVVFLTDGIPTIGATNEDEILATVGRSKGAGTRIFSFGLGTDVNTHLLDRLAEDTRAFTQYVLPEEDIEGKVSTFFTRIKEPVLANLKIQFPKGVQVSKTYPSPLPDLFHGDQLVLVGRFEGAGVGELALEGTAEGVARRHVAKVDFGPASCSSEHEFLPRLWATRRVGYLMDELRLRGESKELKDEVTELARRYGIVTPYTAYLIVEDERSRGVAENRRSLPQLEKERLLSEQSTRMYREFRANKSGDAAVANAQSAVELKLADVASVAQTEGNLKAERGYSLPVATPAPATIPPVSGGRSRSAAPVSGLSVYSKPAPEPAAKRLSE